MDRLDSLKRVARASLKDYKLTTVASTLLIVISVYSSFNLIRGDIYSERFSTSTSTIIFYSAVFIATAIILTGRGIRDLEVFAVAMSTTVSAIWLYELVYHYSFPVYFNYFKYPYFDFNDFRTLIMNGSLTSLILVGHRHITVRKNYYFLTSFAIFSITYALWLLIGFTGPDGGPYLPQIIVVSDPFKTGYILNRVSKLILSISWITLYVKRR